MKKRSPRLLAGARNLCDLHSLDVRAVRSPYTAAPVHKVEYIWEVGYFHPPMDARVVIGYVDPGTRLPQWIEAVNDMLERKGARYVFPQHYPRS